MHFKYIIIWLFLAMSLPGMAQKSVSGIVVSEDKEALIGVTVKVMGADKGTVTDRDGRFFFSDLKEGSQLIFSYIGYTTDTLSATSGKNMRVALAEDVAKLSEVEVRSATSSIDNMDPALNELITEKELLKAACCNLSESFETNASVDVSYSDAVTGAKTIRILGLDGKYALISREGIPHVRGLNTMYGLSFVPGTWLQSIDVGKGAGTVINGYESMTGQINAELKKPENSEKWYLNAYVNSFGRVELNANHATKLSDKWSAALLFHSNYLGTEVEGNSDGFMDLPKSRQVNLLNRYKYDGDRLKSQIGFQVMYDEKAGGQLGFNFGDNLLSSDLYGFTNTTKRAEVFGKTGVIFPEKPYKSWGIQYSLSYHEFDGGAGRRLYSGSGKTAYINAIYQNILGDTRHQYKTGVSYLYDGFDERFVSQLQSTTDSTFSRVESVPGIFYEYNYMPNDDLTLVAGIRTDFHNMFGVYFTPRLHVRYALNDHLTIRGSAGKGYRTPNAIMENTQALVSSRRMVFGDDLRPEIAWNTGGSIVADVNLLGKTLNIVGDYFYTNFENQLVHDLDISADELHLYNLRGRSFAHSFQVEASYALMNGLDLKAAYKLYDMQMTTNNTLQQAPFVSRDRIFVNLAYATKFERWKADLTWNWNGRQRLPNTSDKPVDFQRNDFSPDFMLLNGQISRGYRWGSVYIGGENLLNFKQENPIIDAQNPFGNNFDGSMVWGPVAGRVIYAGIRFKIE
ncbi:MAG TPA: TonB-dependent receptor [Cytophagales bacterium]|jgi:outer membrane receptor for ferrienterochelin and colicins|nr:TonB-dependent receptor [Cytophagales bacterium]